MPQSILIYTSPNKRFSNKSFCCTNHLHGFNVQSIRIYRKSNGAINQYSLLIQKRNLFETTAILLIFLVGTFTVTFHDLQQMHSCIDSQPVSARVVEY